MERIPLPGTSIATSALGYGCSQLMARMSRARSTRLLEEAFDAGITHFDVARSYGYGEAEGALGRFLPGRREDVTVTTKLGLTPPRRTPLLSAARFVARGAVALVPSLRRAVRRAAGGTVSRGDFGLAAARASFETSLRELRTDYVDLLLLHECRPDDLSDDLLGFLHATVREGRARAFGIATAPAASAAIATDRPQFADVIQVPNGVADPTVDAHPQLWARGVITHSALAGLDAVHRAASASPERSRRWADTVGADCADRAVLARLMLAWARRANPRGIVLFSSRNPGRIRANAGAELTPQLGEQAERLAAVVREEAALSGSRSAAPPARGPAGAG